MIFLAVTFAVPAHQIETYERIFRDEFLPLLGRHGFRSVGIWKTLVGRAGEYLEIWEFDDAADYERRWSALASDEAVKEILSRTGSLVQNEEFRLLERAPFPVP